MSEGEVVKVKGVSAYDISEEERHELDKFELYVIFWPNIL